MLRSIMYITLSYVCLSQPGSAEPIAQADVDDFFSYLSQLNRYSPVDGAGSHGSFGINLGVGASVASWKTGSGLHATAFEQDEISDDEAVMIPKIYLIKGTPWPVDLGLSFGKLSAADGSQASGHMQWTVFEALALPAIAARASYAALFGVNTTQFTSTAVDAMASYGFLRFFTAYAGYGIQRNQGRVDIKAEDTAAALRPSQTQESVTVDKSFQSTSYILGLKVTVLPPFFTAAGEYQQGDSGYQSYAAKLNMLL